LRETKIHTLNQQRQEILGYFFDWKSLRKNQGLKPTQVGFACVDAVSNRPFYVKLTPMNLLLYPYICPEDWDIF
jgi:hypothetical protein